jgi:transcriptional regulator with XRE-family HTH domain
MAIESGRRSQEVSLGEYLARLRVAAGMSLRAVEEATDKEVSNAYLSQLEKGRIRKPSPNILHALARVYSVAYEGLMELAGYLTREPVAASTRRRGRAATFAIQNVTAEEEQALMDYLAFLRYKRKRV